MTTTAPSAELTARGISRLKLFHFPASRSARVRWALHETVGDAFEVETVALYDGVQYGESYRQMNPNHCVPLLEITCADGGVLHMIESAAMIDWLSDAFPDKQLSPPAHVGSAARADYLQMLHFGSTWVDMMLWQIRVHEHLLPATERDPRAVARYRAKFAGEVEPQLLRRLARTPFICGERFCAADIVVGHDVFWARGYGLCGDELFRAYVSRLAKRPAFLQAFADVADFRIEPPAESPIVANFTG